MNTYLSNSVKNVDGLIVEYDNKKIGFAGVEFQHQLMQEEKLTKIHFQKNFQS